MRKTTLYLEDDIVKKIKELAIEEAGSSMTKIINDTLRQGLGIEKSKTKRFYYMKKAHGSAKCFGKTDPVAFQRKLRSEWD
ncbi:MAG: ribbon-helix-helix protein, CopG family [bacterium]